MKGLLPKRHKRQRPAFAVLVAAPHVVDENVEPAMITADAAEKRFDIGVDCVVALDGDAAAAALGYLAGGLVDRARHVIRGLSAPHTAASHIHGGPGGAKFEGDAPPGTAARASDQRDGVVQLCHVIWTA